MYVGTRRVLLAIAALLLPHVAVAQDEEVVVRINNRTSQVMQVFALWDGGRTVRLGDLNANQTRNYTVDIQGQELSLAGRVQEQGTRSERVPADDPEDFVAVRAGDQIEWEIRSIDSRRQELDIFLRGVTSADGTAAAAASIYDAEVQREEPRVSRYTAISALAIQEAQSLEDEAARTQAYNDALDDILDGIGREDDNPEAFLHLAIVQTGLGNYLAADSAFDRAEAFYPDYVTMDGGTSAYRLNGWIQAYNEALARLEVQDPEGAVEFFLMANVLYSDRPEAYLNAGAQMAGLGDLEGSIEAWRGAIAVMDSPDADPGDEATRTAWEEEYWPMAQSNLGQVLEMAGRPEEAIAVYEVILARDPSNAAARSSMALALAQTGQGDSALSIFDEILARDDAAPLDYFNAGVSLYGAEEMEKAVVGFRKAYERAPMYRDALQNLAQTLALLEDYEAQIPYSAALLEIDPFNEYMYQLHVRALGQVGNQTDAVAALEVLQALPFAIDNLALQPTGSGANIVGVAINKTMDSGSEVTLSFTFYDGAGNSLGSQDTSVTVTDPDVANQFQVSFSSDVPVLGYSYELGS